MAPPRTRRARWGRSRSDGRARPRVCRHTVALPDGTHLKPNKSKSHMNTTILSCIKQTCIGESRTTHVRFCTRATAVCAETDINVSTSLAMRPFLHTSHSSVCRYGHKQARRQRHMSDSAHNPSCRVQNRTRTSPMTAPRVRFCTRPTAACAETDTEDTFAPRHARFRTHQMRRAQRQT